VALQSSIKRIRALSDTADRCSIRSPRADYLENQKKQDYDSNRSQIENTYTDRSRFVIGH
jgi:hypothetical protein